MLYATQTCVNLLKYSLHFTAHSLMYYVTFNWILNKIRKTTKPFEPLSQKQEYH